MGNSIIKFVFMAVAMVAFLSQAVAQDKTDLSGVVVLVGTSNADGSTDQYMVNMNDGSVFHNKGEDDAEFVGKFDSEEMTAIQEELGQLNYKEVSMTHKDGKAYHYLIVMGHGHEYSMSWNEKGTTPIQNFYTHVHNRCSLLRSDYSIAY